MRLDRAITLLAFRTIGVSLRRTVARLPVLMYHSVSDTTETATPYYRTSTHPTVFAEHMRILQSDGYTGVTVSQGLDALRAQERGRHNQLVGITFDDGYLDFLTAAVPILERHKFRATLYLPTGFIGHERCRFKGRDTLTWGEVSALQARGFQIGSHSVTHRRLAELPWNEIRNELVVSKRTIEEHLSAKVTAFSYPYAFPPPEGRFAKRFLDILRSCGYVTGVTTLIGHVAAHDDALCLKRLPVNSCDDAELLRAKLRGFYNWMAAPQAAAKRLRQKDSDS